MCVSPYIAYICMCFMQRYISIFFDLFLFFLIWLPPFEAKNFVFQFMQWVTENLGCCARVPIDYNEPGYVM